MNLTPDTQNFPLGEHLPTEEDFALTPQQIEHHRNRITHCRKTLSKTCGRARPHTMIVEDQAFSRNLLYEVLHDDCTVTACSNALDGWKSYLEEVPDIAFLDIGLPGTSGHVLADRIKEVDPASYVVMVTASQDVCDIQEAKGNKVDGFIIKPFNLQKIKDCITRYQALHPSPHKMKLGS